LIHFIVPFAVLEYLWGVHRPHPLTISSLLNILGFLRIDAAIEAQVCLPQGNARDCSEILSDWNLDVCITVFPTWTCNNVAYRLSHCFSSRSISVLYMPYMAEYASYP